MGAALLAVGLLPGLAVLAVLGARRPVWLLALFAAVVPWGSATRLPIGLPPAFSSISTLVGLAAAAALAAHLAVARHRTRWIHPATGLVALLAGWAVFTSQWSVAPATTVAELLPLASLVALYLTASAMNHDEADVVLLERAIVLGGAVVGLYALALLAGGDLPAEGVIPRFEVPGGGGENGDPNITAASLLLPLFVGIGRGLRTSGPERILCAVASAAAAAAVVLTVSRGAMVALVLGLALVGVRALGRRGIALVALPALLAVGALALAPQETRDHLVKPGSSGRTGVWQIGLTACAEHCAVGAGYGTFPDVHEQVLLTSPQATGDRLRFVAHNIWLQAAVEIGLLGVTLLALVFVAVLVPLRRLPAARGTPAIAAVAGLALTNSFLSNLDFKYFWLALLYATVLAVQANQADQADQATDQPDPTSGGSPMPDRLPAHAVVRA